MQRVFLSIAVLALLALGARESTAQEPAAADSTPAATGRLRIFLDCNNCDQNYLRTEIPYVDYVRDRSDSDVYILVNTQGTGAGGTSYNFAFEGLDEFEGLDDELVYASLPNSASDATRQGMARVLKAGLVRYLIRTPDGSRLQLGYTQPAGGAAAAPAQRRDPWNSWVFRLSAGGSFGGESSYRNRAVNASMSASRTTADWKTSLNLSGRESLNRTRVGENWIENDSEDYTGSTLTVRSISNHWSVGGRTNVNRSSFSNRDVALRAAPAIEFNLFPYSQSTQRELTLQYSVGANQIRYRQVTIFGKIEETLYDHALSVGYNTRRPWGSVSLNLEGFQYFHDLAKHRVDAFTNFDVRLIRGLSLNFFGQWQRIYDQLHLPAGNLTPEQILLRQRSTATRYRYNGNVSLSYSFGSIFNTVVNPRMTN